MLSKHQSESNFRYPNTLDLAEVAVLKDAARLDSVYQLHGYSSSGGRFEVPETYTNVAIALWCTKKSDQ